MVIVDKGHIRIAEMSFIVVDGSAPSGQILDINAGHSAGGGGLGFHFAVSKKIDFIAALTEEEIIKPDRGPSFVLQQESYGSGNNGFPGLDGLRELHKIGRFRRHWDVFSAGFAVGTGYGDGYRADIALASPLKPGSDICAHLEGLGIGLIDGHALACACPGGILGRFEADGLGASPAGIVINGVSAFERRPGENHWRALAA